MDLIQLILPEILGTLGTLGIEVSNNTFKTESTDEERGNFTRSEIQDFGVMTEAANEASNGVTERIKEEFEEAVKVETEDTVDAFEEITFGNVFHNGGASLSPSCRVLGQDMGKIKDIKRKIPKMKISKKLSVNTKANPFSCDIKDCKLTFIHRGNLNKHIRNVHNKEKPYQCGQCFKKFSVKNNLKGHILSVHNEEKAHQCNQCFKKFGQTSHLSRHLKTVHSNQKPFQCDQCLKKFSRKENMRVHIAIMHQEKPHACPHPGCEEKFGSCAEKNSDEKFQE